MRLWPPCICIFVPSYPIFFLFSSLSFKQKTTALSPLFWSLLSFSHSSTFCFSLSPACPMYMFINCAAYLDSFSCFLFLSFSFSLCFAARLYNRSMAAATGCWVVVLCFSLSLSVCFFLTSVLLRIIMLTTLLFSGVSMPVIEREAGEIPCQHFEVKYRCSCQAASMSLDGCFSSSML